MCSFLTARSPCRWHGHTSALDNFGRGRIAVGVQACAAAAAYS